MSRKRSKSSRLQSLGLEPGAASQLRVSLQAAGGDAAPALLAERLLCEPAVQGEALARLMQRLGTGSLTEDGRYPMGPLCRLGAV